MKKTQLKDTLRNIRKNVISWLAVAIVVTITCGVYCGVFHYADAMEDVAEACFAQSNFEDLTVTAAGGLTEEDIRELLRVPGVLDAEGTYRLTGGRLNSGRQSHTAEFLAVTERISVPELLEGRLPDSGLECALTPDAMERFGLSLGEEIRLEPDGQRALTFSITGTVRHPEGYYQGEGVYVFLPASTLEALYGGGGYPVVLVDASCGGSLLSDTYLKDLAPIRAEVRAETEWLLSSREAGPSGFAITARADHEGFMVLRQIVDILRQLSTIFVVIFVVIGAIVVTSTVTVVIDGQKRQIGFLKAYGFTDGEIIRRYLVYGESAVLAGMLCAVGVAFLLQIVIRGVLGGMFCLEVRSFTLRLGSYALLLLVELVLTGIIAAWVTVSNASRYSAVELLSWNGSAPAQPRKPRAEGEEAAPRGTLYSRLILRNIRSDRVRVTASTIIIAGCCFMIGIGLTLNSAFHSMTGNTRREVARYDLECAVPEGTDPAEAEAAVKEYGAACAWATKTRTVYSFRGLEEYVTVIAADREVYGDYLCLVGPKGKPVPVPEKDCVLIQDRIAERLEVREGEELTLYDGVLEAHPLRVSGTARNYIGRVMYLSRETYTSVFGVEPRANTLLVRLGGADGEALAAMLTQRFPEAEVSYTDSMPGMFSGLTDAFNALIYVLITLSVIMSVFVLLNLVNIFVSRRKNELIIMGVNGFSYREEIGYLLRETVATTAVGLVLGAAFGAVITKPVVQVIEAPDTMCARGVNWRAWAVGIAAEAVFALLINLYAFRKVRHWSIGDLK